MQGDDAPDSSTSNTWLRSVKFVWLTLCTWSSASTVVQFFFHLPRLRFYSDPRILFSGYCHSYAEYLFSVLFHHCWDIYLYNSTCIFRESEHSVMFCRFEAGRVQECTVCESKNALDFSRIKMCVYVLERLQRKEDRSELCSNYMFFT